MRVKREAMRQAILAAAAEEFSKRGYLKATMGQIARRAGTAPSNIYVYYKSKLEIAVAVYEPWFRKQIILLERSIRRKRSTALKVQCLVDGILRRIPNEKRGLTTTLVQALATARPTDVYSPQLLQWTEGKIAEIIQSSFDKPQRKPADSIHCAYLDVDLRRYRAAAELAAGYQPKPGNAESDHRDGAKTIRKIESSGTNSRGIRLTDQARACAWTCVAVDANRDRELADADRPNPYAAAAATAPASSNAAATSADTAASTAAVAAAPAAVRRAPSAAAAMSTPMASAAMATSASCGKLYARRCNVVFVKDIKSRQADVGDFFVSEHYRCGLQRRDAAIRNSRRGCAACQRQCARQSQRRDGCLFPTSCLGSPLHARHEISLDLATSPLGCETASRDFSISSACGASAAWWEG